MSTDLLEAIRNRDMARREQAIKRYADIIARSAAPKKGDIDDLAGLMATLGIDDEQLAMDLATFQRATEAQSSLVPEAQLHDLETTYNAAVKTLDDAEAEWDERRRMLDKARHAAYQAFATVRIRHNLATETITRCRESAPMAFGLSQPQTSPAIVPAPLAPQTVTYDEAAVVPSKAEPQPMTGTIPGPLSPGNMHGARVMV